MPARHIIIFVLTLGGCKMIPAWLPDKTPQSLPQVIRDAIKLGPDKPEAPKMAAPSGSTYYTYTDASGTTAIVDDLSDVPEKYRSQARVVTLKSVPTAPQAAGAALVQNPSLTSPAAAQPDAVAASPSNKPEPVDPVLLQALQKASEAADKMQAQGAAEQKALLEVERNAK